MFSNNNQEWFATDNSNEEILNNHEAEVTAQVAEAEIMMVMQEVSVMGGNDSEMETLKKLLKDLKGHQILPKEAINKAVSIRESKQDYH